MCCAGAPVEDDSCFLGSIDGALKPVRIAERVGTMPRRFAFLITRVQDLKDVKLPAARLPARAAAILYSSGNLCVEYPSCRHIGIEPSCPGKRHAEFKEKQF